MPNATIHNLTPTEYRLTAIDLILQIFGYAVTDVETMNTEEDQDEAVKRTFALLGRRLASAIDVYALAHGNLQAAAS